MKIILVCLTLLLALVSLGDVSRADNAGQPAAAGMGVLTGVITKWPRSPVQGPGIPQASAPAAGVKLLAYGAAGSEPVAALTDREGRFRLELPPGTYRLELAPGQGRAFSKNLPATVTIAPGRETSWQIRLDIGIR
jgi:hypothetical protein